MKNTFRRFNHVWKYNADRFCWKPMGRFTTEFYNILQSIKYELDPKVRAAINQANITNAVILNTVLQNYTGNIWTIPSNLTTPAQKLFLWKEVYHGCYGVVSHAESASKCCQSGSFTPQYAFSGGWFLPSFIQYLTGMNAVIICSKLLVAQTIQVEAMINNLTSALAGNKRRKWLDADPG